MTNKLEIITKSKKKLILNYPSWENCWDLKTALELELDASGLFNKENYNEETIINIFFRVDASKGLKDKLFTCLEKSLYDNKIINNNLLTDSVDARNDYYEIAIHSLGFFLNSFKQSFNSALENPELTKMIAEIMGENTESIQEEPKK